MQFQQPNQQNNFTLNEQQKKAMNDLVNQILTSPNPQESFNKLLETNREAKAAYDAILQYGNGDPKSAIINYAVSTGKQNMLQGIVSSLFGN